MKSWVYAKGKVEKRSAKTTLAEVIKEMAKPKVARSAPGCCHISRKGFPFGAESQL